MQFSWNSGICFLTDVHFVCKGCTNICSLALNSSQHDCELILRIRLFSDVSYFLEHLYWRRLVVSTISFGESTKNYWAGAKGARWITIEFSTSPFIAILTLEELSPGQPIPILRGFKKSPPISSSPWLSRLAFPRSTVSRLVGPRSKFTTCYATVYCPYFNTSATGPKYFTIFSVNPGTHLDCRWSEQSFWCLSQ